MKLSDPSTLCLFVLAAAVVFLMIRTRVQLASQRQKSAKEEAGGDSMAAAKSDYVSRAELAKWEVEMHETARGLSAQLDAKLSLLQSLIAEADRAAAQLEAGIDRATSAQPPRETESPRPVADREGLGKLEAAGVELDRMPAAPEPPAPFDRTRRRDEIYQLADYGFSQEEIARRVGSPVGEVELILSLRGK